MIIITENERIDINDYGMRVLRAPIPSPALEHKTEQVDWMDGEVYLGSRYTTRVISAEIAMRSTSHKKIKELKVIFRRLFARKEEFYVMFKNDTMRRYRVVLNNQPDWTDIGVHLTSTTVELRMCSVFAEAPGTTLTLEPDLHYYQAGEGEIDTSDPPVQYIFDQTTFSVFNDSDITIEPENKEIRIELQGMLINPIIRNLTTGDEWSWSGTASSADIILLDGVRSFKNDVSIFKETNKNVISLLPGWNDFQITGAADFLIKFDFRMYYV
ncbi:phage tail domain-containing protein [Domibacillus aminovorans]|uniref:Siphovirus-type tail component RIFT-related domain-containing protein n=1 Tax=Domibacillus aminovorans TaxID=29332 RepID=A0A177L4P2_9BACI|nr:phage tail domain-containing protein [Domibacillus aminovorans]OAH60650.1 hypothetical protein AWH49_15565 [Domibacillus aminovorans]